MFLYNYIMLSSVTVEAVLYLMPLPHFKFNSIVIYDVITYDRKLEEIWKSFRKYMNESLANSSYWNSDTENYLLVS